MKHIKTYKIFENKDNSDIIKELEKYNIRNYTINNDGTIDVDGNVDLYYRRLTKIPFKFGNITGNFDCSYNKLKDLIGGPQEVGGNYICYSNKLESLEGCAGDIGGMLHCNNNQLEMLDCSSVINGNIYCNGNGFKEEPEFFGICGGKINWE